MTNYLSRSSFFVFQNVQLLQRANTKTKFFLPCNILTRLSLCGWVVRHHLAQTRAEVTPTGVCATWVNDNDCTTLNCTFKTKEWFTMQQLSKNPFHHCIYSIKKMASRISGYFSFNSVHLKTQKQTNRKSLNFLPPRFMKITRLSLVWYRWKSKQQHKYAYIQRNTIMLCVCWEISNGWHGGAVVSTATSLQDGEFSLGSGVSCHSPNHAWDENPSGSPVYQTQDGLLGNNNQVASSSQLPECSELLPCAWVAICLCKQLNIYLSKSAWWVCVVDFVNWGILC